MRPGCTIGNVLASKSCKRASRSGASVAALMSGSTLDRSRTRPSVSTRAGFSAPLAPCLISFMNVLL